MALGTTEQTRVWYRTRTHEQHDGAQRGEAALVLPERQHRDQTQLLPVPHSEVRDTALGVLEGRKGRLGFSEMRSCWRRTVRLRATRLEAPADRALTRASGRTSEHADLV